LAAALTVRAANCAVCLGMHLAAALQRGCGMLVYRSFVVGLLGAACLLLAQRQRVEVRMLPAPRAPVADHATIVDVSAQASPRQLVDVLRIHAGARVDATGPDWSFSTTWLESDDELTGVLAGHVPARGGVIDLTVDGHRTLVLGH
jgi:hypothetical protein